MKGRLPIFLIRPLNNKTARKSLEGGSFTRSGVWEGCAKTIKHMRCQLRKLGKIGWLSI